MSVFWTIWNIPWKDNLSFWRRVPSNAHLTVWSWSWWNGMRLLTTALRTKPIKMWTWDTQKFKLYFCKWHVDLFRGYIKQIMNVLHWCNGKNIFIRWKVESSMELFHLSTHENNLAIALINIHYLYNSALLNQWLADWWLELVTNTIENCVEKVICDLLSICRK